MERKNMMDKITNLEDTLDYERNKSQLGKSKVELRKS